MRSCVESWIRLTSRDKFLPHISARWIQPFQSRNPELSRLLMRCYAQNPFQCQDAWKGTGPDTAQKYPMWTWMGVYNHGSSNLWEKRCLIKTIEIHWAIHNGYNECNGYNEYNGYKECSVHMCTRFFWRIHPLQVLCEGLQYVERACCGPYLQFVSTGRTGTLR